MSYKITDECISCSACEAECKNGAISEGANGFVIDANKCTECVGWFDTAKCVEACPSEAIVQGTKESKEQLLEKFKKLNPGK